MAFNLAFPNAARCFFDVTFNRNHPEARESTMNRRSACTALNSPKFGIAKTDPRTDPFCMDQLTRHLYSICTIQIGSHCEAVLEPAIELLRAERECYRAQREAVKVLAATVYDEAVMSVNLERDALRDERRSKERDEAAHLELSMCHERAKGTMLCLLREEKASAAHDREARKWQWHNEQVAIAMMERRERFISNVKLSREECNLYRHLAEAASQKEKYQLLCLRQVGAERLRVLQLQPSTRSDMQQVSASGSSAEGEAGEATMREIAELGTLPSADTPSAYPALPVQGREETCTLLFWEDPEIVEEQRSYAASSITSSDHVSSLDGYESVDMDGRGARPDGNLLRYWTTVDDLEDGTLPWLPRACKRPEEVTEEPLRPEVAEVGTVGASDWAQHAVESTMGTGNANLPLPERSHAPTTLTTETVASISAWLRGIPSEPPGLGYEVIQSSDMTSETAEKRGLPESYACATVVAGIFDVVKRVESCGRGESWRRSGMFPPMSPEVVEPTDCERVDMSVSRREDVVKLGDEGARRVTDGSQETEGHEELCMGTAQHLMRTLMESPVAPTADIVDVAASRNNPGTEVVVDSLCNAGDPTVVEEVELPMSTAAGTEAPPALVVDIVDIRNIWGTEVDSGSLWDVSAPAPTTTVGLPIPIPIPEISTEAATVPTVDMGYRNDMWGTEMVSGVFWDDSQSTTTEPRLPSWPPSTVASSSIQEANAPSASSIWNSPSSSVTWDSLAPRGTGVRDDPLWPESGGGERS